MFNTTENAIEKIFLLFNNLNNLINLNLAVN